VVVLQAHPVVSKVYITFGDNGWGRLLSEGEVRVSEKVVLKRVALVESLDFNLLSVYQLLDRALRCCLSLVLRVYLMLEVTLCVWSFLRVKYFVHIFLSVSWLVLHVSCGSGIEGWVT
jgi:hypothetical protein